jgi:hypothetical protein
MNKQAQLIEQLNKNAAEYTQARERFAAWRAADEKVFLAEMKKPTGKPGVFGGVDLYAERVAYPTKEADRAFINACHKLMKDLAQSIKDAIRPHQQAYEAAQPKLKADAYKRYNALIVPVNAMLQDVEGLTQERIERVVAEFGEGVKTLIAETTQSDDYAAAKARYAELISMNNVAARHYKNAVKLLQKNGIGDKKAQAKLADAKARYDAARAELAQIKL